MPGRPLEGKTVALCGRVFGATRAVARTRIETAGGVVTQRPSANTTYVVVAGWPEFHTSTKAVRSACGMVVNDAWMAAYLDDRCTLTELVRASSRAARTGRMVAPPCDAIGQTESPVDSETAPTSLAQMLAGVHSGGRFPVRF